MKRALITGVTGQDGSLLADFLLPKGYEVFGVARRTSQDATANLVKARRFPHFHLVDGDITDFSSVIRLVQDVNPDEIYNLAAQSHVGASFSQPALTWSITAQGAMNVFEAARILKSQGRIYHASSSEQFGSAFSRMVGDDWEWNRVDERTGKPPDDAFQDEDTPFVPNSPYAIAKVAAHNAARMYRESYGMFISCGILMNHESPRRGPQFVTRKITKWLGDLRAHHDKGCRGEAPRLRLGNQTAQRDWGFAGDYVEAMWLMLQQDKPDDFLIATGITHSVHTFVSEAILASGLPQGWAYDNITFNCPEFVRPLEVPYLRGEAKRARCILNWQPKTSFAQLVKMMVDHDSPACQKTFL